MFRSAFIGGYVFGLYVALGKEILPPVDNFFMLTYKCEMLVGSAFRTTWQLAVESVMLII
jgi:hypothetical protein